MADHPVLCRVCESACGLVATVEAGRVVGMRPDPGHPISRGYACVKGTTFHERVQHAPARLRVPTVRGRATSWADAIGHVGAALARVADVHGPDAVGVYSGNAAGNALGAVLGIEAFVRGFGTRKHYSCLTLDNAPMFVVLEACLGNPLATFVADYEGADLVALIGTDPLSSSPSQAQSNPDGVRQLREVARRGQLVVVDPRRSATARKASLHLQPRPGADVALLACLVRAALPHAQPDARVVGLDALRDAVAAYDVARTASATGLPPEAVDALIDRLLAAERPLVWSGLGVLLGPDGTVGYWLTFALQALLGGLDRPGGWRPQAGPVDVPAWARRLGLRGHDPANRSRVGGFPAVLGTHAAATLADDILTPGPDQLRALVVVGGNPAASLPDTPKARAALASLDLLACLELLPNETTALAHAVLPARTWLEREDWPLHLGSQRPASISEGSRPVVPVDGVGRTDWDLLTALVRAAGRRVLGSRAADLATRWIDPASAARHLGRARPSPGLRSWLPGRAIDLAPAPFVAALRDVADPEPGLRLVTSVRPIDAMNTWLPGRPPRATVHPDHLVAIGLADGAPAALTRDGGEPLVVALHADPSLPRDVVVVPFGLPGANRLIPATDLERFTGQPRSNGARVRLARP